MPWRELLHTSGSKVDYAVASLLGSGSAFMLFVEQTTPLLGWLGLLIGVLIGAQRFVRNWKHWHHPPK